MPVNPLVTLAKYIPSSVAEPAARYLVRAAERNAAGVGRAGAETAEAGARVASGTASKLASELGTRVAGRAGGQAAQAFAPVLDDVLAAAAKNPLAAKVLGFATKYGSLSTAVVAAYQWIFGGDTEQAKREGRDEVLNRLGGAAGVLVNGNPELQSPEGALKVLDQALRNAAANPGAPMDPRAKAVVDLVNAYDGKTGAARTPSAADERQDRMMSMMFDELTRLKSNTPCLTPTPIAAAQSANGTGAAVGSSSTSSSSDCAGSDCASPSSVDWR